MKIRNIHKTVAPVFFAILSFYSVCYSQQNQITHRDYAGAIGLEDDYIVMANILLRGLQLQQPGRSSDYYINNASFFSLILLLSEVKPASYYLLEQNGIDLIHAISADTRPFSEQSLLADLVIEGTVTGIETNDEQGDGFDVSVSVLVNDILKGGIPNNTITIRQRNITRLSDSATRPEVGHSYIFLLSSGVYGYQKANHNFSVKNEAEVSPPDFGRENTFVIYRMYRLNGGVIENTGIQADSVKKELQLVDRLIHQ